MIKLSPQARFKIYASKLTMLMALAKTACGRLDQGGGLDELTANLKRECEVQRVALVSQARVGIYLALKYFLRGERKKVILSPYTIADVVNMVVCSGGIPIFVDVNGKTCNLDAKGIGAHIDDDTAVVLVTHLHGLVSDMSEIKALCQEHELPLVEDAAQAYGANYKGAKAGRIGDVGVYSFGRYKHLNGFVGGAIVSDNKGLMDFVENEMKDWEPISSLYYFKRVMMALVMDVLTSSVLFSRIVFPIFRYARIHKIDWINRFVETELDTALKREFPEIYKRKMVALPAKIICDSLSIQKINSTCRLKHVTRYENGLQNIEAIIRPRYRSDGSHLYTCYPLRVPRREEFVTAMMKDNRDLAIQHIKNCASLPSFSEWRADCPEAEACADSVVMLPTYPSYDQLEAEKNIHSIKLIFAREVHL